MADRRLQGTLALNSLTQLAFARTRAAYERMMMAWIRTATSLITFGFSIYKVFQLESEAR
jgi:putative membrane protein